MRYSRFRALSTLLMTLFAAFPLNAHAAEAAVDRAGIRQAYEAKDFAKVLALGKRLRSDRDAIVRLPDAAWRVALALEQQKAWKEALEIYGALADGAKDHEAMSAIGRMAYYIDFDHREVALKPLTKKYPKRAPVMLATARATGLGHRDQIQILEAAYNALEPPYDGNTTMIRYLQGDLLMEVWDFESAVATYRNVANTPDLDFMFSNLVRAHIGAGQWEQAREYQKYVVHGLAAGSFHSPKAEAIARQMLTDLEDHFGAATRDSLAAYRAALVTNPAPADADFKEFVDALQGADTSSSYGFSHYRGEGWHLVYDPRDHSLAADMPKGWEAPAFQDRAGFLWEAVVSPDRLAAAWDPERGAFSWSIEYPARDWQRFTRGRVLAWPVGRMFLGDHAITGKGVVLSVSAPPYRGPCRFGIPVAEANVIARVIESRPLEDGESLLHCVLADSMEFIGSGYQVGRSLVPTGYGRLIDRKRGTFFGRFLDGVPADGAFVWQNGDYDVLGDKEIRRINKYRTHIGDSHWESPWQPQDKTEVTVAADRAYEYFDMTTSMLLRLDRRTGHYSETRDEQRLAKNRERIQAGQRAREDMARFQKERDAELAAEREARYLVPETSTPSSSSGGSSGQAFSFTRSLSSNVCVRCRGMGQIYVAPTTTQGWTYSDVSKQILDTTIYTSGHMKVCHWCNGTGKR
ncbi:MAG: hypothetical protein ABL977_05590 [Candidatus Eisenbacteria bacterium]